MKKIFMLTLFFCVLSLNSQMLHYNSYIDIPSANYTDGLFVNLDGNFPLKSASEVKFDPNFGIEYTYRELNAALKWYNGADFAFDVSYQIQKEEERRPSIAIGIYELSFNKFISPAGSDETYDDEEYAERPPEIVSLYGVATKNLNKKFQFTMGIGRGKFVGYGPRSFVPNTDVLFNENHENWALGLFMGLKMKLNDPMSLIFEADGRDANLALEYKNPLLKGTLYFIKMEQIFAGENSTGSVRMGLNFSYNLTSLYEQK
jgi:hypothetical protein